MSELRISPVDVKALNLLKSLKGNQEKTILNVLKNWLSWGVKERSPLRSRPGCLWQNVIDLYCGTKTSLACQEEKKYQGVAVGGSWCILYFKWDRMLMFCTIAAFSFAERIKRAVLSSLTAISSMRLRVAWYYNEEFYVVPDQCRILWGSALFWKTQLCLCPWAWSSPNHWICIKVSNNAPGQPNGWCWWLQTHTSSLSARLSTQSLQ